MGFSRITAVFTAFVIILCSLGFTVSAAGAPTAVESVRLMEKMEKKTFNLAGGKKLDYRIYRSSGYDISVDTKPAVLIIYFHNESGKGSDNTAQLAEKGLLHQLVSDSADILYSQYQYIVVAPQCPQGQSFTDGKNGTEVLDMVEQLRKELGATEILTGQCMVAGVGSGADAAFVYASKYASAVSRLVTVGGTPDKGSAYGTIAAGVSFFCFAEETNLSVKELDSFAQEQGDGAFLNVVYTAGGLEASVEAALAYNAPSVTEWMVKDAYESRYFAIHTRCTESGGKISASPDTVRYGGNAKVILTVNKGYAIDRLVINSNDADIALLKQTENNKNQYIYEFKNVTLEQSLVVELVAIPNAGGASPVFGTIIMWLTIISAVLICAALSVFGYGLYKNKKA